MTAADSLNNYVLLFISIACFLQGIEDLLISLKIRVDGSWNWKDLERLHSRWLRAPLRILFSYNGLILLCIIKLLCAFCLIFAAQPVFILPLFLSTYLISVRWQGSFNGGSDQMTLMILLALSVEALLPHHTLLTHWVMVYIGVNALFSYFLAGWAKFKRMDWKNGQALKSFVSNSIYCPPQQVEWMSSTPLVLILLSWVTMAFELSFPVAITHSKMVFPYLLMAGVFHLAIFFAFGLNRFFFAWSASFPAIFYLASLFEV